VRVVVVVVPCTKVISRNTRVSTVIIVSRVTCPKARKGSKAKRKIMFFIFKLLVMFYDYEDTRPAVTACA
jgi:hypothetical protein